MFGQILQKFAEKSPATVMVRALLEQLLNPEKLDQWFEVTRQTQYTRDILFSSLVGLMLQIVCKTQASVHAAYRQATTQSNNHANDDQDLIFAVLLLFSDSSFFHSHGVFLSPDKSLS